MSRVAISTSSFGAHDSAPLDRLRARGYEVILNPHGRRLQPDETRDLLSGVHGLIAGTERLDRSTLEHARDLRVISRCGVGVDRIDPEALARLGIALSTTTEAHVDPVAELALAGMLSLLRHLPLGDRDLRAGRWKKTMGSLLRGRVVGIVGLGRTGRRLVELLQPFGVGLLASDPAPDPDFARRHRVDYLALDELLTRSDLISLHATLDRDAGPLLDADRLALMKRGALLVNTARGNLIDERALVTALERERLGGVYLDVFPEEPYCGPLLEFDNVVVTPHVGSYAIEGRVAMENEAVDNLLDHLEGAGA